MVWKPPETMENATTEPHGHGPMRVSRIRPVDYTRDFLHGLQVRNEIVTVSDDWDGDSRGFPPHVTWVRYPNGDLERIGFA